MAADLDRLLAQEQALQFTHFNEDTAWAIGCWLIDHARAHNLPITVDIQRGDHQLFHASRPGTSPDNDDWVRRKVRVVRRFGHSSFYMGQMLKQAGRTMEDKFLLPEREYAAHGGSFPIIIRGTGVVGTITVSGLPQAEDHDLVVQALEHYLSEQPSA